MAVLLPVLQLPTHTALTARDHRSDGDPLLNGGQVGGLVRGAYATAQPCLTCDGDVDILLSVVPLDNMQTTASPPPPRACVCPALTAVKWDESVLKRIRTWLDP